jgi:hypothetical protein
VGNQRGCGVKLRVRARGLHTNPKWQTSGLIDGRKATHLLGQLAYVVAHPNPADVAARVRNLPYIAHEQRVASKTGLITGQREAGRLEAQATQHFTSISCFKGACRWWYMLHISVEEHGRLRRWGHAMV